MCGVCEERRLIEQMQVCTDDLEVVMYTLTLDSATSLHVSDIIIQKLESHVCTSIRRAAPSFLCTETLT